jgi:hypothetical protein
MELKLKLANFEFSFCMPEWLITLLVMWVTTL